MADTDLSDLGRERARAERDVEQVRQRIDRDRSRLDGGQVSAARELSNLQSEIESLLRRQSDLEEVVLDAMERRETAEARRAELVTEQQALTVQAAELTASAMPRWKRSASRRPRRRPAGPRWPPTCPPTCWRCTTSCAPSRRVGAAALRRGQLRGLPPARCTPWT